MTLINQHLNTLNNLRWANISAIVDIKIARACAELHLLQEELKKKEEICAWEIWDLANIHRRIGNELKRADLEMEVTQNNISCTRETIVVAQLVLQAEELKFSEIKKHHEVLTHQKVQIQQEVAMWNKALDDVRAQAVQHLIMDEDELHCQATVGAKEAHSKSLREMKEKLKTLGEYWEPPCIFLFFSFEYILYFTTFFTLISKELFYFAFNFLHYF